MQIDEGKIKRFLEYVILNGVMAYAVYAGVLNHSQGWENISKFMIIYMFIFGTAYLISQNSVEVYKEMMKRPQTIVPDWFDKLYDAAILFCIVYSGWIGFGVMYLIGCTGIYTINKKADEWKLKIEERT